MSSNNIVVVDSIVNTTSCNFVSFANWHFRLGHPSVDAMKIVFRLCNLSNVNKKNLDFCNHCCIGKSHRLSSSSSLIVYEKNLILFLMIFGVLHHFHLLRVLGIMLRLWMLIPDSLGFTYLKINLIP